MSPFFRSSWPYFFYKIVLLTMSDQPFADFPQNRSFAKLEMLQNSEGNIKSLFLIKFQVSRLATWLKRVSNTVFFLRIFSNFEGIFFIEYLRRLLLKCFEGFKSKQPGVLPKLGFPEKLRIIQGYDVIESAENCGFDHIHWKNP